VLLTELIVLLQPRSHVTLESKALVPVGLGLPLTLQLLLLRVRDVLPHRDDLLGETVEPPLVRRPVLRLPLHQVLVVHYQVLYLRLQPLVRMLQLHVLLSLPSYLVVATLYFILGLLVFAG
jgi:hypothetical protein